MIGVLILAGCINQKKRINCLNEILLENNSEVEMLVNELEDSVYSWAKRGLEFMSSFNSEKSTWYIDGLLLNSSSDKLFGWILQVYNEENERTLDYINFFSGEKINGKWFFYLHSMPSIWASRKDNEGQKHTFEDLSEEARKRVVEGGLIKYKCEINDSYINGWIDREDRRLYEWHQEFLKSEGK